MFKRMDEIPVSIKIRSGKMVGEQFAYVHFNKKEPAMLLGEYRVRVEGDAIYMNGLYKGEWKNKK